MDDSVRTYIENQNYNAVTRFLHGGRQRALRRFLDQHGAKNNAVLEIGCGPGNAVPVLQDFFGHGGFNYLGLDLIAPFIDTCRQRFGDDPTLQFLHGDISVLARTSAIEFKPSLVIALECFEHLRGTDLPDVVGWVAALDVPLFVSVPNETGPAVLIKNAGSWLMGYERYREYSFRNTIDATLGHFEKLPPHRCGHMGFDWRWLLAVLRCHFTVSLTTAPFPFVPRTLSPSIYFTCLPRRP